MRINFLLVAAATLYHQNWFYPAAVFAVGTHYLPFMFLYGNGGRLPEDCVSGMTAGADGRCYCLRSISQTLLIVQAP